MKMKHPKVSVIIPSWNRKDDLRVALKSIFRQDYKNLEVIVVDNMSSDGTEAMVKKEFPKVRLLKNTIDTGVSTAKNQGILASKGQYLLFCDSDIEMMNKNNISTMIKIMQKHPEIGALGGEAYKIGGKNFVSKKKMITINCETSTIVMPDNNYTLEECDYVATCNCMMPCKLLFECGGFDNAVKYGGEDKEMGIKIARKGYKSIVDSRCLVYHYISQSTKHRSFYLLNKNRIRIVIKNYGLFRILFLPLLDIIAALSPKKFKDLKSGSIDVTKYVDKDKKKKNTSFAIDIMRFGLNYAWSIIKAYGWNLMHLFQTIATRMRKPNYLTEIEHGNRNN